MLYIGTVSTVYSFVCEAGHRYCSIGEFRLGTGRGVVQGTVSASRHSHNHPLPCRASLRFVRYSNHPPLTTHCHPLQPACFAHQERERESFIEGWLYGQLSLGLRPNGLWAMGYGLLMPIILPAEHQRIHFFPAFPDAVLIPLHLLKITTALMICSIFLREDMLLVLSLMIKLNGRDFVGKYLIKRHFKIQN